MDLTAEDNGHNGVWRPQQEGGAGEREGEKESWELVLVIARGSKAPCCFFAVILVQSLYLFWVEKSLYSGTVYEHLKFWKLKDIISLFTGI